jgi:hypothetical protein
MPRRAYGRNQRRSSPLGEGAPAGRLQPTRLARPPGFSHPSSEVRQSRYQVKPSGLPKDSRTPAKLDDAGPRIRAHRWSIQRREDLESIASSSIEVFTCSPQGSKPIGSCPVWARTVPTGRLEPAARSISVGALGFRAGWLGSVPDVGGPDSCRPRSSSTPGYLMRSCWTAGVRGCAPSGVGPGSRIAIAHGAGDRFVASGLTKCSCTRIGRGGVMARSRPGPPQRSRGPTFAVNGNLQHAGEWPTRASADVHTLLS